MIWLLNHSLWQCIQKFSLELTFFLCRWLEYCIGAAAGYYTEMVQGTLVYDSEKEEFISREVSSQAWVLEESRLAALDKPVSRIPGEGPTALRGLRGSRRWKQHGREASGARSSSRSRSRSHFWKRGLWILIGGLLVFVWMVLITIETMRAGSVTPHSTPQRSPISH